MERISCICRPRALAIKLSILRVQSNQLFCILMMGTVQQALTLIYSQFLYHVYFPCFVSIFMRPSSTFDRKWMVMVIFTFAMMDRSCNLLLENVNAMKIENLNKKKSPSMSGFPLPLSTRLLSFSASSPSLSYLPLPLFLSYPFYVVIFIVRPFSLVFREKS